MYNCMVLPQFIHTGKYASLSFQSLNYSIYIGLHYIRLFLVLYNKIAKSEEESMQKFTVTIHSLALGC